MQHNKKSEREFATEYRDAFGNRHRISPAIRARFTEVLQPERSTAHRTVVLGRGEYLKFTRPAELIYEDGTRVNLSGNLPRDLPVGYHQIRSLETGATTHLLVKPDACYLPDDLRMWGWAVQLYALRSRRSWGMGDLADLRNFSRFAEEQGAGLVILNPTNATKPLSLQEPSPYFPSSRLFRNPLYLRIEEVPGANRHRAVLARAQRQGRALNEVRLIDRNRIFQLKMRILHRIWKASTPAASFEKYCQEEGETLTRFATYCALAEFHERGWSRWPVRFQHPDNAAVRDFREKYRDRIRFHQWLQWLLRQQFREASVHAWLIQDLPVGFDPDGADAWMWQDFLALNMSVGAPPDAYNTLGQDWGLPPFIPHRLHSSGFAPFRETVRAAMQDARGLRIDHVLGLFRQFWIPKGCSAQEGTYVRFPTEELFAVLAIESQRAKTIVVGENLGTVTPEVVPRMNQDRMLAYHLFWFENKAPESYSRDALAVLTTHDLFTMAGLWSGADLVTQEKLRLNPNVDGTRQVLAKFKNDFALDKRATAIDAARCAYERLAKSPSRLVAATLEDAMGVEERPNIPGVTAGYPNWSLALPMTLEQIRRNASVRKLSQIMARARKRPDRRLQPASR